MSVVFWPILMCVMIGLVTLPEVFAQEPLPEKSSNAESTSSPVELTADSLDYDQVTEVYVADGSVEIVQGTVQLTADHVTLHKLSGDVKARGHVHLRDRQTDVWSEALDLNLNTEKGIVTDGEVFMREQNSFVTGQRLRRYSETHYRGTEGSFTNCDAKDGEVPAWRFTFREMNFDWDDSIYGEGVWFNINDVPILPLPPFRYPLGSKRKTGLLIPTVGVDNVFGFRYRQGFFWAITPSQDFTVSPLILSKRGGGSDFEYRYIIDRQSKGNWILSTLYDTEQNRGRADINGAHIQEVNPDLSLKLRVNYSTDRSFLQDLSNTGALRALPSQESLININQRLPYGSAYLLGQYLQPLSAGGTTTFQRVPELGVRLPSYSLFGSPLAISMDSTFVHFFRQKGYQVSRLDLMPGLELTGLHLGHVVGLKPQMKFRDVSYTRGTTSKQVQSRETFWAALEASTYLSRRFKFGPETRIRHSIEPSVIYEFVPPTDQSKLVQIDAVDDLQKKSLVTYSLKTRLSEQNLSQGSSTWVDFFIAQSYHVGTPPSPAKRFSDIWGLVHLNRPIAFTQVFSDFQASIDAFYDPHRKHFSQWNTDARVLSNRSWYLEVGQRYTRSGPRVRRGDIWNPISFNEVLSSEDEILFLTAGGAIRLPFGLSVGSKIYRDIKKDETSELDIVGFYQNPCRCFSLGLYYIQFPDRTQFNFLFSLTGLWAGAGEGQGLMKTIFEPIFGGERGVPWSMN
ncbi:MAG: LPS assembly protein LptD [Nitrospirales bacterium]|nr:LPS-assembly protein LptD [Nitrospira sp.]MDR4502262.1 LPS assembly protein LptD [Nitrospirales bacterium]